MSKNSPFTSLVTQVLPVPGFAGHTITIRKLAPKHLRSAAQVHQLASIGEFREMGGAAFMEELRSMRSGSADAEKEAAEKQELKAAADPTIGFDRVALFTVAVTGWTFDQERNAVSFDDLDEDIAAWLATEIMRLAKPSAYEVDAGKND